MTISTMSLDYQTRYNSTAQSCECPARKFNPSSPCKHMAEEARLDALADASYTEYLDEVGKTIPSGGFMLQMAAIAPNRSFNFNTPKAQLIIQAFNSTLCTPPDLRMRETVDAFCVQEYGIRAGAFVEAYRKVQGVA